MIKSKITFLYGQGLKKDFKKFEKYFNVPKINWNTWEVKIPKNTNTLIGFSMGAILACEYSTKKKIDNLVLCSIMPGIETLMDVKAKQVFFLVGEKEKWVISEISRISKTLTSKYSIIIIPNADHRITGDYEKKLLEIVEKLN